jgi:hypothetical protein
MRKSVVWIPFLLVGAMLFWTLALGLGGRSLMTLTEFGNGAIDDDLDGCDVTAGSAKDSYQSITVNLSESPDPGQGLRPDQGLEAVPMTVDLVPDGNLAGGDSGQGSRGGRSSSQGPGDTAF